MEDMHLELKPGKTSDYEYTEAVKTLRTNIQFCGSSVRVIMLTSAIPSEGKSDLSFATAEALAQIMAEQVRHPCEHAAERAENAAPVVHIEEDEKARTGDEDHHGLCPGGIAR